MIPIVNRWTLWRAIDLRGSDVETVLAARHASRIEYRRLERLLTKGRKTGTVHAHPAAYRARITEETSERPPRMILRMSFKPDHYIRIFVRALAEHLERSSRRRA